MVEFLREVHENTTDLLVIHRQELTLRSTVILTIDKSQCLSDL